MCLPDDGTEKLFEAVDVRKKAKAQAATAVQGQDVEERTNQTQEQHPTKRQTVTLQDMFPSRLAADAY